jgi:D-lactate dehydrogenase
VHTPVYAGCCGMAGDRGMLTPALTQAATAMEAKEIGNHTFDGYYASSKTCEMALQEGTSKNYESLIKLVDEVSA